MATPAAAVKFSCTPDDGCDGHQKYVEYICSKQIPAYCCILLDLINIELISESNIKLSLHVDFMYVLRKT